jgi:quinoprotein glucose dehydrogenase
MLLRPLLATLILGTSAQAASTVFQAFEGDGFDTWQAEGNAFGLGPIPGSIEKTGQPNTNFSNYAGDSLVASLHGGDTVKGKLTSPEFTISEPYINFQIAGGDYPGKTAVQLIVKGQVVRESLGKRKLSCDRAIWNVMELKGEKARIRLVDDESGAWGFIAADHFVFTDSANLRPPPSTRGGKEFYAGLSPSPDLPGASIPTDSKLRVEADFKSQQVTSPTALTFDDQGRIYLSETHRFRFGVEDNRNNLYWYLDDLAAKKTSDRRALHEKWKEKLSIEKLTEKSEVIRRLADTDGDGKLDESTVFAEGFNDVLDGTAAGVFYYDGCLYFACIPKVYMLRAGEGDSKQPPERKVVEEGFGVRISLSGHDLNGFTLGPDGRIYGTLGDRGMSVITKEGVTYDYPNEGCVFRFEPDGSNFEVFHTGLRNPKEIAFDALGNPFTVDNNSDQGDNARIVYLVEGGDSGWQMEHQAMHTFHREIGLKDHPPSRWMDEKMWEMENPSQPAFMLPPSALLTSGPSGMTYHPGVGFLESERNHFLITDYRGGAANSGIWSFEMKPKGAGMEMTDSRQLAWGIAATDVEYSWDGRVFITDFITGWSSHNNGRLLSLDAGDKTYLASDVASAARLMKEGFEQRSAAELANLLKHPDMRIRLRAQTALSRKTDALKRFTDGTISSNFNVRLHSIWGLGIIARRGSSPRPFADFGAIPEKRVQADAENVLIGLLEDKNTEIKIQALRALGDSKGSVGDLPIGPLLLDESPRVRFFTAILIGKRKMISYYSSICDLLRENDNRDVTLRHACIFALQHMATSPTILSALSTDASPAVRLAATVALRRMNDPSVDMFLNDADPKVADEAIRAVCDNDMVGSRPLAAEWLDRLETREWTPFMLRRLIHNAYRVGGLANAERLIKVARNSKHPLIVRQEAVRLLSNWTEPFPVDQLTGIWRPLEKRDAATIRPALSAAIPSLLTENDLLLSAALDWVGIYQLKIPELNEATLRDLIKNPKLPSAARSSALNLFIASKPSSLSEFLAEISEDPSDEVVLTALSAIAKISPETALPSLITAINSPNIARAQKVWPLLATLPGTAVDQLFLEKIDQLRAAKGISPTALDLLTAAKKRGAAIKKAVLEFEQDLAKDPDPLAKWNPTLQGGNPVTGASLFASHPASECMRCHRAEEGHAAGGETAPNLAGIGKRFTDPRYFLQSMVDPSAVIASGFGAVLIEFKNGATLTGNLLAETPEYLDIDASGKSLRVSRSDIATFTPPVSPMPTMGDVLKPAEIRDLVAWLGQLTKGSEVQKSNVAPTPLDPATLTIATETSVPGIDPAIMKAGKTQFLICGACHGQQGEGTGAGPPLAGSEWVNGPAENLIRIQLRGLTGPIMVKGKEYNFPAGMAAQAYQNDDQISSVLTYIRNSFGNSAPAVKAADVAALRSEVGKPPVTAAELIPPVASNAVATAKAAPVAAPATQAPDTYRDLGKKPSKLPWIFVGLLAIPVVVILRKLLRRS